MEKFSNFMIYKSGKYFKIGKDGKEQTMDEIIELIEKNYFELNSTTQSRIMSELKPFELYGCVNALKQKIKERHEQQEQCINKIENEQLEKILKNKEYTRLKNIDLDNAVETCPPIYTCVFYGDKQCSPLIHHEMYPDEIYDLFSRDYELMEKLLGKQIADEIRKSD